METLATENGMASSTVLINMTQGLERKMTGSGAQSFLTSLIKSKWLREIVRIPTEYIMIFIFTCSLRGNLEQVHDLF